MIIFGTRGVTTTPETGQFSCPSCQNQRDYGLKRVRRFFTLYFIPVIPLDKLGEYVECNTCKDTYKPEILSYDPAANEEAIEAEYQLAIRKVMLHMLLADGVIDDAEVESVMQIYQQIAGIELSKEQVQQEIVQIQKNKEDLLQMVYALSGKLNDSGKELVIKAAFYIAMADGEFQDEEKTLLLQIGESLGMTPAHIHGVLSTAHG